MTSAFYLGCHFSHYILVSILVIGNVHWKVPFGASAPLSQHRAWQCSGRCHADGFLHLHTWTRLQQPVAIKDTCHKQDTKSLLVRLLTSPFLLAWLTTALEVAPPAGRPPLPLMTTVELWYSVFWKFILTRLGWFVTLARFVSEMSVKLTSEPDDFILSGYATWLRHGWQPRHGAWLTW